MIRLIIHSAWIVALTLLTTSISTAIMRLGDGLVMQAQESRATRTQGKVP